MALLAGGGCRQSGGGGGAGAGEALGAAAASPAEAGDTRVLVYGDSLWDTGGDPERCDLCALFPADLVFTNYAQAGAEIWPARDCDGRDDAGAPALPDPGCRNGADRALRLPGGECGGAVAGQPTCLAENPAHDVLLLQFGTNDVRGPLDAGSWLDDADAFAFWLEEILAERPDGMACVLVVPPPIWSEHYEIYNARLEDVGAIVGDAAARYGCAVADLYGRYLEIEAEEGEGATLPLYRDCAARGAREGDCLHYALPRPIEAADPIVDAIDAAAAAP